MKHHQDKRLQQPSIYTWRYGSSQPTWWRRIAERLSKNLSDPRAAFSSCEGRGRGVARAPGGWTLSRVVPEAPVTSCPVTPCRCTEALVSPDPACSFLCFLLLQIVGGGVRVARHGMPVRPAFT